MASMGWEKTGRRWRVFWHVKLPDGTTDKGSKSFKDKKTAKKFKEHCEKKEKQLKRAVFVEQVFLTDALEEWTGFCQGYTEETQRLYIEYVNKFVTALPDNVIYITDLTKFHINSFLSSMMKKEVVNKTVNNYMCAIKSLCSYIHENFNIPNPSQGIKKFKEDPAEPHFLTMEEYKKVLENSRDIAKPWIRFIAHTGLRATEFCELRWKNCDLRNRTITIIGKGRKKRTICLNDTALEILQTMKAGKKVSPTDTVFRRYNGLPLSRDSMSSYIRKACCNSGLSGGGPHALRHLFATQLLLRGIPIIKVSILLGHGSVSTTQRHYSHILSSDLSSVTEVLKAI